MGRLRYIREQAGYSQQDLANESGVSQHTISEIELGRRKPQGRTLRKLAKVLGVRVADLHREPDHPKGRSPPLSAEWARSVSDKDAFRRVVAVAPTEELQGLATELVAEHHHTRLLENERGRELSPEVSRRTMDLWSAMIVAEVLASRGERVPETCLLVLRRQIDALTTPLVVREDQESREAG